MRLRRKLHARGLRYRVDVKVLTNSKRRADVVFARARVVVLVHGCFWHSCPLHATTPKANAEWWQAKLSRNRTRDAETRRLLEEHGWRVLEVWEHEDASDAADRVVEALAQAGS